MVERSTVYLENWHIDLIAEHLEAITAGLIKRLLINLPQDRRALGIRLDAKSATTP